MNKWYEQAAKKLEAGKNTGSYKQIRQSKGVLGCIAQADEERATKLQQAVKAALEQMGGGAT